MREDQFSEQFIQPDSGQRIDIREYINVVLKRIKIVIAVCIVVFLLSLLKTYSEVPIFTATSQVLIERNRASRSLENQFIYYEPNFLSTQSEIIKSANVARKVVDNLQLHTKYHQIYFKKNDDTNSFLRYLRNNVTNFVSRLLKKEDAKAKEVQKPENPDKQVAKRKAEAEIIASIIQGGLNISQVRHTKIVNITYSDKNPLMAKLITNEVVKAYMDEVLEIKLATSNYTLQWMSEKAEEERTKLQNAELILQKYMRDNDLVTIEDRLAIYPQKLSAFSAELLKAQTERKELESLVKQIQSLNPDSRAIESISVFADSVVLKELREQIYKSRQKIKELSKKFGPKHPTMVKARDELNVLLNEKRFEIGRIIESTKSAYELKKSKEQDLRELQTKAKSELLDLNEKFIQFSIMKREVDTNRVLYDALTSSINKESVTEQTQSVNIWVIKEAVLPGAPAKPNKRKAALLGLLMGLVSGVGLAFLVEYLDNTVKREKDLETRFRYTVLGTVDEVTGEDNIETFMVHKPLSPISESYRLIRSGILLSSAEHPPKTILTTSMGPREGKTSTTLNLARILAQNKMKILVMDCDMRRPRLHTLFDMPNDVGLSNYLSGTTKENILHTIPGGDITVITAGTIPPNPAELLTSNKMELLLAKVSEVYDHVLLDSPPIHSVTDALTLSAMVDGTIVVVRAGKTTYEMLENGLKKLRDVKGNILGFVLNARRKSDTVRGYYGSGYGYGYGYSYSKYYAEDDKLEEENS